MNIMVTGGAGFIGSHVCQKLLELGHRVVCYDNFDSFYDARIKERNIADALKNPAYRLVKNDILEADVLRAVMKEESIETVIHLAARAGVRPSIQQPVLYNKVNAEGTLNVLEAMRSLQIGKLIMASSSSVYGNNRKTPYAETDNVDTAISPYAATKKANEVMAYTYHHLYAMNIFCLRFFTVYGPRQRPEMAIHLFTRLIDTGLPIQIFGDGKTFRDYTYIDDIIHGIVQCITHARGYEILNLGESQTVALIDLVRLIERKLGKTALIQWQPLQPGDVAQTFADISKARKLIGYDPHVKIEEGIERFVDWYKNQKPLS